MKLLYILPEYVGDAGGGIIAFYRDLLPALVRRGHEVRVVVGSGLSTDVERQSRDFDGVRVERLEHSLFLEKYARFARYASQPTLRRLLAGAWALYEQALSGPAWDVVETVDWGLLFLPWYVQQAGNVVVQLHGSTGQIGWHDSQPGLEMQEILSQLIERAALRPPLHLHAYSRLNTQAWGAQGVHGIVTLPPAWKPVSPAAPSGERRGRAIVVGRVQRWKGPQVLCEALRELGADAPGVDWVGRDTSVGSQARSFSQVLASSYPAVWGSSIRHVDQVPATEVAQMQRNACFVIVPSEWDTFNFTCVEAMAAAAPVICSTGAGASELIEDGRTGILFESGNARDLAEAIRRMLALSPAERAVMGEAGRAAVAALLDPETNTERRLAEYERIRSSGQAHDPLRNGDWLADAVRPGEATDESFEFLHNIPLRTVAGHAWQRAMAKVTKRR